MSRSLAESANTTSNRRNIREKTIRRWKEVGRVVPVSFFYSLLLTPSYDDGSARLALLRHHVKLPLQPARCLFALRRRHVVPRRGIARIAQEVL
jgi:hypothetical protein